MDATDLEGQIVEVRTRVTAGEHLLSASYLRNYHGLPPSYKGPEPSKRPPEPLITPRGKLTEKDIETLRKFGTKIKTDRVETRVDNRYESIDVGGPFNADDRPFAGEPAADLRMRTCRRASTSMPVRERSSRASPAALSAGRSPRTEVRTVPQDRYARAQAGRLVRGRHRDRAAGAFWSRRISCSASSATGRRRQDALRSRSASTNWRRGSPISCGAACRTPSCFALRVRARLRQPAVLAAQVRRMLRDPKSRALVENFAGQWLQFKNIDVVRPDWRSSPISTRASATSMRRETELFLENIIREGRQRARVARCQLHLPQ